MTLAVEVAQGGLWMARGNPVRGMVGDIRLSDRQNDRGSRRRRRARRFSLAGIVDQPTVAIVDGDARHRGSGIARRAIGPQTGRVEIEADDGQPYQAAQ